ncbi:AraC-like DNA-binding protein OS=Leifsonia shinshuensis OX=150026 GN=HNR13_001078 PE=4 SV=1 [Leifsonia shinshuensis]
MPIAPAKRILLRMESVQGEVAEAHEPPGGDRDLALADGRMSAFATADVDEARFVGSQMFYGGAIRPDGRGTGFEVRIVGTRIGPLSLGLVGFGTQVSIAFRGLGGSYGVTLPMRGTIGHRIGSREYAATPDAAAVIGLADAVDAAGWAEGARSLHLRMERGALEAGLSRMLGVDGVGEIRFPDLLDLRSGRGADWAQLAGALFGRLERDDGLVANALFAAQLSDAVMTGLLLATDHQYREALDSPPRPAPPATIRRAAQFIDENAHLPITVPDVAAAVGANTRTLSRGFRDHLDTSPGAYLARARLDGAHRELAASRPERTSVSQVAAAWGFFNPGRFASRYRATFGVLPSQTLRSGS